MPRPPSENGEPRTTDVSRPRNGLLMRGAARRQMAALLAALALCLSVPLSGSPESLPGESAPQRGGAPPIQMGAPAAHTAEWGRDEEDLAERPLADASAAGLRLLQVRACLLFLSLYLPPLLSVSSPLCLLFSLARSLALSAPSSLTLAAAACLCRRVWLATGRMALTRPSLMAALSRGRRWSS